MKNPEEDGRTPEPVIVETKLFREKTMLNYFDAWKTIYSWAWAQILDFFLFHSIFKNVPWTKDPQKQNK